MNFIKKNIQLYIPIILSLSSPAAFAQSLIIKGKIVSNEKNMPLGSASIQVFKNGKISGSVSNGDGEFRVSIPGAADSIKFSMIGYRSRVIDLLQFSLAGKDFMTIQLMPAAAELEEVILKPLTALEIIQKSIAATRKLLPAGNFENHFFYREIIKDTAHYYSIAEAIFRSQYFPLDKKYKLQLVKGRTREDVAYTRLFEDFHPGGGPEGIINESLSIQFPSFLDAKKTKWFTYHKDAVIRDDNRKIYVISFDQRPDIHEALDRGKIYIDAGDYSLIKYESQNSLHGIAYIKNLTGTEKLFAELLHINYKRKGWTTNASYSKQNDILVLNHAYAKYEIAYSQPKKNIDLDLSIITEMVVTGESLPVTQPIVKGEEWKRKNIVANLPADFDGDFWGNANIISPTAELDSVLTNISKKNTDSPAGKLSSVWQYYHKDLFVAHEHNDSITLIPIMKGAWEDDKTAGMLYQNITGDFTLETQMTITKRSDAQQLPDNGFQQAGIIIRDSTGTNENSIILAMGTGGNSNAKYFLRRTDNGKSKGPVNKIDSMNGWLRFEKRGNTINCYIKNITENNWNKIASYDINWLSTTAQAGIIVMASFAGNGPKAHPDMKAIFTKLTISKN